MLTQYEVDEIIAQWPPLPEDIEQQLKDIALPSSRYLFYRRGKAVGCLDDLLCGTKTAAYYGFCTHCQTQSRLKYDPGHNELYNCPACGSACIAKKHGLGTKHLFESGNLNVLQANGDKLYIRQLHASLDYRKDKLHPEFKYYDNGYRWLLSAEGCYKLVHKAHTYLPSVGWEYIWTQQKTFSVDHNWAPYAGINAQLLDATYLKNSHAIDYLRMAHGQLNELILYAAAYTKHPSIESFVNAQTIAIAEHYTEKNKAIINRMVNWKKVRPHEMLRIQKEELPLFLHLFRSNPHSALCYQKLRLAGQRLSDAQWRTLNDLQESLFSERPIRESLKNNRILKMLNYLARQLETAKKDAASSRYTLYNIVTVWRDYLKECDLLTYDLTDDSIYYPPNLIKQHNRTMKLIKFKEDEISRQKAAARFEKLNWMTFEQNGLLIRPAESANALAAEGKALNHCVASYADRYISGNTAIFFIRKSEAPDKSYFTLELNEKDFSIRQNRGKGNCSPPDEVTVFVDAWLKWLPIERKRLERLQRQEQKTA